MKHVAMVAFAVGVLGATPGMAQPRHASAGYVRQVVLQRVSHGQIEGLQRKLNSGGFDAGVVDGL